MGMEGEEKQCKTMIFTYGTLKKEFPNHPLLEDLMRTGDAVFKGCYTTAHKYPLVCGPYKVPFLLNMPGSGHNVAGELYAVSSDGLARVDELEGTTRGHYQRLPIQLTPAAEGEAEAQAQNQEDSIVSAEAYFAHTSYDRQLWTKNRMMAFSCYSHEQAKGYVKRKDRPSNLSFLDHISIFLSSSG